MRRIFRLDTLAKVAAVMLLGFVAWTAAKHFTAGPGKATPPVSAASSSKGVKPTPAAIKYKNQPSANDKKRQAPAKKKTPA